MGSRCGNNYVCVCVFVCASIYELARSPHSPFAWIGAAGSWLLRQLTLKTIIVYGIYLVSIVFFFSLWNTPYRYLFLFFLACSFIPTWCTDPVAHFYSPSREKKTSSPFSFNFCWRATRTSSWRFAYLGFKPPFDLCFDIDRERENRANKLEREIYISLSPFFFSFSLYMYMLYILTPSVFTCYIERYRGRTNAWENLSSNHHRAEFASISMMGERD